MKHSAIFIKILFLFFLFGKTPFAVLFAQSSNDTVITSLPYIQDFDGMSEYPSEGWRLKTTSRPFLMAPATLSARESVSAPHSLYLINSPRTAYVMLISPRVDHNIQDIEFSLYYKAAALGGILEIGVISDTADVETFVPVDTVRPADQNWNLGVAYLQSYAGSGEYIAVRWSGAAANLYIDNIVLKELPRCFPAPGFSVEVWGGSMAMVRWPENDTVGTGYTLQYAPYDSIGWQSVSTLETEILLTSLQDRTRYKMRIRRECGEESSEWSDTVFIYTMCNEYEGVEIARGRELAGGEWLPFRASLSYSATQQIYSAEELGGEPFNIDLVGLQLSRLNGLPRSITLYMGHTDLASYRDTGDWIPSRQMREVFRGEIQLMADDDHWAYISLDSVFRYDGSRNLVILIDDNTGRTLPGYQEFYTHATPLAKSIYFSDNSSDISADSPQGSYANVLSRRNNIRFFSCSSSPCIRPQNVGIAAVSAHSAELSWYSTVDANEYEIAYKTVHDTVWRYERTYEASGHTLTGLAAGTFYTVKVRSVCSEHEVSRFTDEIHLWTACGDIRLPYRESFDAYNAGLFPRCWMSDISGTVAPAASEAHFYTSPSSLDLGNSQNGSNTVIFPKISDNDSNQEILLSFRARNNADNGLLLVGLLSDTSDLNTFQWMDTVRFISTNQWQKFEFPLYLSGSSENYVVFIWKEGNQTLFLDEVTMEPLPDCLAPSGLTATSIDSIQALINWTERGVSQRWSLVYGPQGFDRENAESFVIEEEPPYLLENLISNTEYELYIRADCITDSSEWSEPLFFRTKQQINTTPSHCDFENAAERRNWTLVNENQRNQWYIDSLADTTDRNYLLYISNDGGATNRYTQGSSSQVWAYRDIRFGETGGDYLLSLEWRSLGSQNNAYFTIFLADTGSRVSAGSAHIEGHAVELVPRFFGEENWTQSRFIVPGHYRDSVKRLYILWYNHGGVVSYNPPAAIGDISLEPTLCSTPENIISTDTTLSSVVLAWERGGTESEWYVEYGPFGFLPGNGDDTLVTDTVFLLDNLFPGTLYDVYISAYCGPDAIGFPVRHTFSTLCESISLHDLPYREDFENYGAGSYDNYPVCWHRHSSYSGYPRITGQYASSGYSSLVLASNTSDYTYAVLPPSDYSFDIRDVKLDMKLKFNNFGYDLYVGVMEDPDDPQSFEALQLIRYNTNDWEDHTVLFSGYSGTGNYIALRSGPGYSVVAIDELVLSYREPCLPPTGLSVSDRDVSSARVTWSASASDSVWHIGYKAQNESVYTEVTVDTAFYLLTGLNSVTTYEVRVKAVCSSGEESGFESAYFTTLPHTYTIRATSGENGSIYPSGEISVNEGSDTVFVIRPDIYYSISGVFVDSGLVGTDSVYTFRNIRANHTIHAEFLSTGVNEKRKELFVLYPNPAANTITVRSEEPFDSYEIVTMVGQKMRQGVIHESHFSVDISSLPAGIYIFRMTGNGNQVSRKLVKK